MDEVQIRERVRICQTSAQLFGDINGHVDRERDLFFGTPVPHRAQVPALHEVHGEEQLAPHQPGVEHGNQVPVRQLHDNFRFIAEPRDVLRIGKMRKDGLDDHQSFEPAVTGHREIERTHAALSQGPQQVILAEFPGVMLQVSLVERHAYKSYHGTQTTTNSRSTPIESVNQST